MEYADAQVIGLEAARNALLLLEKEGAVKRVKSIEKINAVGQLIRVSGWELINARD